MEEERATRYSLHIASLLTAFLPYPFFSLMVSHNQSFLEVPTVLAAFIWLGVTVYCYRKYRTRSAASLFAMAPVAFARPYFIFGMWLWSVVG
jgi:hypothetical protein